VKSAQSIRIEGFGAKMAGFSDEGKIVEARARGSNLPLSTGSLYLLCESQLGAASPIINPDGADPKSIMSRLVMGPEPGPARPSQY
jgi:hypothetical protein